MGNSSYRSISKGEMRGSLDEEVLNLLPGPFFEDPISAIQKMEGEWIKESKLRLAAIFTLPNQRRIFFKRDMTKGWVESFKYSLFPTKARKEWLLACQLRENLNIPRPLGWMERVHRGFVKESYYLSEAIGSGLSFIEDPAITREGPLVDELAKTVRKIHDAGLFHKDLHAGNVLWDGESFFLVDLHRARIVKSLSLNHRLWNLSQLFHSLRTLWEDKERLRFVEKYLEGNSFYLQKKREYLQKVHSFMDRLQKRQWRSRTKRCLKESTEFSLIKEAGVRYYHRRDFPLDRLKEVVEKHLHIIREKPSALVKKSSDVLISILNEGKNKVCVKQYCYPRFWDRFKDYFRPSKGLRSWVAGNGLLTRGIPNVKPLALIERRDGLGLKESLLIVEAIDTGIELDRYILKGYEDFMEKRVFIKVFARWLSNFHKMGLYHRDMKTCNILVSRSEGNWNFHLLDLEDVLLDKPVDEGRLHKNLLQLNTSTPKIINRIDRFRFYREYLGQNSIVKNEKSFLRRLIEESRRRDLVYVSPQGVVIEKF
jgi:tRNA A-37 threonylcarbamoyl transferase component Bud32